MKRWLNLATLWKRPKPNVGATPHDVVHAENKWRLLRFRPRVAGLAHRTPVLLVPSLINRWYVLDLLPTKSFIEFLVAQGHDTYVIDWGTPGDEDRFVTFDDIVEGYIGRALRVACRESGAARAHMLGYCMGGTMAAIHAAVHPTLVASVVAVAAPIRFRDHGLLSAWSNTPSVDLRAIVAACGNVPWQLMQSAFQLLRPTLNLSKAVHLLDRAWDDEYLDGFLALETWGTDNVSFPGEAYVKYIDELYRQDRLVSGTLSLGGRAARLEAITAPTLAITFEHDHIVPWESAKILTDRVGATDKEWLHMPGGHVGAMVSRAASKKLWPTISAWWASRDDSITTSPSQRPGKRRSNAPVAGTSGPRAGRSQGVR